MHSRHVPNITRGPAGPGAELRSVSPVAAVVIAVLLVAALVTAAFLGAPLITGGSRRPATHITRRPVPSAAIVPVPAVELCPAPAPGQPSCDARLLVAPRRGRPPRPTAVAPHPEAWAADEAAGDPEPAPGSPGALQQAYDLTALARDRGHGDTVAVVDAFGDPTAARDLAVYRRRFDLPPCTTGDGCLRIVDSGGAGHVPAADPGWQAETALDLDAISALCPNCRLLLVEAAPGAMARAQATAAALGADQISDSWAYDLSSPPAGRFSFPGIATVAATGDSGSLSSTAAYPAALPDVTAAGGSDLAPAANLRGFSETAWARAGSGCAKRVAKPAWQTITGCKGRAYADVSADAGSGIQVYDSGEGGWVYMDGTSESAPLVAAFYALTGATGPAWDYQHAGPLFHPAAARGGCRAADRCPAGHGYDGATGIGSISGQVVTGAPGIGGPDIVAPGSRAPTPNTYASAVTDTSATITAGLYPNGLAASWWVQYGTNGGYQYQSAPEATAARPGPLAVRTTLSGLRPQTLYHARLVAGNAAGLIDGYDFSFRTGPNATGGTPARDRQQGH
jgi:hypothetical protein